MPKLIGIQVWDFTEFGKEISAEYMVDKEDKDHCILVTVGSDFTKQHGGVEIDGPECRFAVETGKKYGIFMPSGGKKYTLKDGEQFLIAVMTMYWRGSGYTSVKPFEE